MSDDLATRYNTVRRPGKTDIDRAIEFAEDHRTIHLRWINYYRRNPPRTRDERLERRAAGGIRHQQIAVRRYDVILKALRAAAGA